jgi:hypothetical protein
MQDAGGNPSQYQRIADSKKPMALAPGVVFTPSFAFSHIYICKPELVTGSDARYSSGLKAKNLYYQRLQRLYTIPVSNLTVPVPNTTPFGTGVVVNFPNDFTYGMICEVSSFDVAWTGLLTASGLGVMNLDHEVADDHESRMTNVTLTPFALSAFPSVKSRAASISGTTGTMLSGFGNVFYYKLPVDW